MNVITKLQIVHSGIRMEDALTGTRRLGCSKYGRLKQCNVLLYENKLNDQTLHGVLATLTCLTSASIMQASSDLERQSDASHFLNHLQWNFSSAALTEIVYLYKNETSTIDYLLEIAFGLVLENCIPALA